MGGFSSLTQCAQFAKLGVFWGILQKNKTKQKQKKKQKKKPKTKKKQTNKQTTTTSGVFSAENGILNGAEIVLFIGIANGDFSECDRHIRIHNLGEYPPLEPNTTFVGYIVTIPSPICESVVLTQLPPFLVSIQ